MEIVNMHEAKTHLSRLVEKAAAGESFIIAKAGKPMVKVTAVDEAKPKRRVGFMEGMYEYRMTLTRWGRRRLSLCSRAKSEATARYTFAALGWRVIEAFVGEGPTLAGG